VKRGVGEWAKRSGEKRGGEKRGGEKRGGGKRGGEWAMLKRKLSRFTFPSNQIEVPAGTKDT